ncbi:MAG: ATP-binding cassette domain-containing protein [Oscillospiraceae bacterium]|nr:ATP-binding cassette domain-containing protein [Oscillospiraceae bacterium]
MALNVDIEKSLGDFHLNVRFEAADCEVLGLLGASGCGKSMTLRCIAGIVKPDRGKIVLDGRTLFDSEKHINLRPQQRGVGLLFQNYALFPNMTVCQNILTGAKSEPDRTKRREACAALVESLGLTGLENHRPAQLSGGQQQRVALARILISHPKLIMLDEPFSALDSFLRWQTEMEISALLREFGTTTLLVSHNQKEVYRMCDKVCVVSAGKSQRITDVDTMFDHPETTAAALLAGCKNFSALRRLDDTHVEAADWGAVLTVDREIGADMTNIGVHGYHFRLASPDEDNVIKTTVERIVEDTDCAVAMVRAGNHRINVELPRSDYAKACALKEAYIHVDPQDIMLLKD